MRKKGIQLDNSDDSDEDHSSTPSQDEPIEGSAPSSSIFVEDEDEDEDGDGDDDDDEDDEVNSLDDDFIVEDAATAPMDILPAQFSMTTHQGLQHHFKLVCQYFVHMILCHPSDKKQLATELLASTYQLSITEITSITHTGYRGLFQGTIASASTEALGD